MLNNAGIIKTDVYQFFNLPVASIRNDTALYLKLYIRFRCAQIKCNDMFQSLMQFLFGRKKEVPVPNRVHQNDSNTAGYFGGDTGGYGATSDRVDDASDYGYDTAGDSGGGDGGGDGGGGGD